MAISSSDTVGSKVGGRKKAKTDTDEGILVESIARKLREQGECAAGCMVTLIYLFMPTPQV